MIAYFNTTVFDMVQEAIIIKWMTYCKAKYWPYHVKAPNLPKLPL